MELWITINLTTLLVITFFVTKKQLSIFENIYLFLVLEFWITSYYSSIYATFSLVDIASSNKDQSVTFILYEIILLPLLYLSLFNLQKIITSRFKKVVLSFFFLFLAIGFERILVNAEVIQYTGWNIGYSSIVLLIGLVGTLFLWLGFRRVLVNEGVLKQ
ncbi:hypothetical protein [Aquibacillus sediminis]|uniref:hypothetical protein n=1 Tax=Aquibacillus sediminis TaxID=2574734 RepID=UPI0011096A9F|nr:hypothetical protein [Aquibacillus sediminis]